MKYSSALKQGNRVALAIAATLMVLRGAGLIEALGLAVEQVDLVANGVFIAATLIFEAVAQRAEKHELTGGETVKTSSGAIVGEVDDPTPVDGTIEAVPQRKATRVRGERL